MEGEDESLAAAGVWVLVTSTAHEYFVPGPLLRRLCCCVDGDGWRAVLAADVGMLIARVGAGGGSSSSDAAGIEAGCEGTFLIRTLVGRRSSLMGTVTEGRFPIAEYREMGKLKIVEVDVVADECCVEAEPNSRVPEEEVVDEDRFVLRAPTHKCSPELRGDEENSLPLS